MKTKTLHEIEIGKTFKIGGIEFVKFQDKDGTTAAVTKDILFSSAFGINNNFAQSKVLERLQKEILPKIEDEVGADNIIEFETDLLSLDGSDKHGKVKSKISLPTFDFYREHVKIFDQYKVDEWWWTSTPDTTSEHYNDYWIVCVSPHGFIRDDDYHYDNYGVRPFCIFNSSISVSCEE